VPKVLKGNEAQLAFLAEMELMAQQAQQALLVQLVLKDPKGNKVQLV
jgi:hypothetical protein